MVVVIIALMLPMTFFLYTGLREARWPEIWPGVYIQIGIGSLIAILFSNEILIQVVQGNDKDYWGESMDWGLGQIIAVFSVAGQLFELFVYLRSSHPDESHECGK